MCSEVKKGREQEILSRNIATGVPMVTRIRNAIGNKFLCEVCHHEKNFVPEQKSLTRKWIFFFRLECELCDDTNKLFSGNDEG